MNKNLAYVVVVVLVIIGGWYFIRQPAIKVTENQNVLVNKKDLESKSISSAYIYGPELNKVKVYLYAPDERKSDSISSYCGAPVGSKIISSGNYQLIVDSTTATSDNPGGISDLKWNDSTLNIGQTIFVKNTPWDGKIIIDQFDPLGYKNFIVIQQYGSCNGNIMQVYGYDFSQGKLVQYPFNPKNNPSQGRLFVTSFKKSDSGNLATSTYDNTVGKTVNTEWLFDSNKNQFVAK